MREKSIVTEYGSVYYWLSDAWDDENETIFFFPGLPCDLSSCTTCTPALTGTNLGSPGQPQEQTPVDDPHAEVEIKTQLKPRGSVANKEDPKPSHQL